MVAAGGIIGFIFSSAGSGKEQPLGDCKGQMGLISLRRTPQISAL